MGYLVSQLSLQQINDTTYKKMTSNHGFFTNEISKQILAARDMILHAKFQTLQFIDLLGFNK